MSTPEEPPISQAEYIERCVAYLEGSDFALIYRQAASDEKVRLLKELIAKPQHTGVAGPAHHQEMSQLLAKLAATQGLSGTFNPMHLQSYLVCRKCAATIWESEKARKKVWEDMQYEQTDTQSEEWKVFCTLKAGVLNSYLRKTGDAEKSVAELPRLLGKFLSFSNGGEDISKTNTVYVNYKGDGIYLRFAGPEGGDHGDAALTIVEKVESENWMAFKDLISFLLSAKQGAIDGMVRNEAQKRGMQV